MPEGLRLKFEGLTELHSNAAAVSRRLAGEMETLHGEVVNPVAQRARSNVRSRSGALKRSIKTSATGTGRTAEGVISAGEAIEPYAGVIHYGWADHNIKPNRYLTDALAAEKAKALKEMENKIERFLRKTWKPF